jgi:hypothetical protein
MNLLEILCPWICGIVVFTAGVIVLPCLVVSKRAGEGEPGQIFDTEERS